MSKINLIKIITSIILSLAVIIAVPVRAEVFLFNQKPIAGFKDKFVYQVNAGETSNAYMDVVNNDSKDVTLSLSAKDTVVTREGGITVDLSDKAQTQVGSWIKLDVEKIIVPAKKTIPVHFSVTVPQNTISGEYLGLVTAQPEQDSKTASSVAVNFNKTIKVFLQVKGGDYKLSSRVSNLNILDPKDTNFSDEQSKLKYLGKDNLVARFEAENTGNIFSRIEGNYKLIQNGQVVKQSVVSFDLVPNSGLRSYYIVTNVPYVLGNTVVEFSYKTVSQNIDEKTVKIVDVQGSLKDSLDMSQSDLNGFSPAKFKAIQTEQDRVAGLSVSPKIEEKPAPQSTKITPYFLIVILILLLLAAGLLVYTKYKRPELWKKMMTDLDKNLEKVRNYIAKLLSGIGTKPKSKSKHSSEDEEKYVEDDYKN